MPQSPRPRKAAARAPVFSRVALRTVGIRVGAASAIVAGAAGPVLGVLEQLVLWKAEQRARPDPPPALYRLHVVEADSLEVSAHRVFADPECSACRRRA